MPGARRRPPSQDYPGWEDPLKRAQSELDGRSRPTTRPERNRPSGRLPVATAEFPACPDGTSDRTWKLTRQFIEDGEGAGHRRVVSPWYFARELSEAINASTVVLGFIESYGQDQAQEILSDTVSLYWKTWAESRMSRAQLINEFLDHLSELFDRAATNAVARRLAAQVASGEVTPRPVQAYRSLLNDPDYQAKLADIQLEDRLNHQLANEDADPGSSPGVEEQHSDRGRQDP